MLNGFSFPCRFVVAKNTSTANIVKIKVATYTYIYMQNMYVYLYVNRCPISYAENVPIRDSPHPSHPMRMPPPGVARGRHAWGRVGWG